jgi:hypothetical protein
MRPTIPTANTARGNLKPTPGAAYVSAAGQTNR